MGHHLVHLPLHRDLPNLPSKEPEAYALSALCDILLRLVSGDSDSLPP